MAKYPQRLLTDDETVLLEMRPHWRVLIPVVFWLLLGVGAVVTAATQYTGAQEWVVPVVALLSLVFVLGLAVPPLIRWFFTQFVLTSERIVVREGFIARSGSEIPLEQISNVLFSQRVIERLLGYGDVLIESAGESGQTRLRDVRKPEDFQSKVYAARERRALHFSSGGGGGGAVRDRAAQLKDLADLHANGSLTDEEYASEKAKVLGASEREATDEG